MTAPDETTVTHMEVGALIVQSEGTTNTTDAALVQALLDLQTPVQSYILAGTETTNGNPIYDTGATRADGTSLAQTDQSVPATGFAYYRGTKPSPQFTMMQLAAVDQGANYGVLLADHGWGGQSRWDWDATNPDKWLGQNQLFHLREAKRIGDLLGITTNCPYLFDFQGTQAKDTPGATTLGQMEAVYNQIVNQCLESYGAAPTLMSIINGGDVNTIGDVYATPGVQYAFALSKGGIIATWQRDFWINDQNIHTSASSKVLEGEIAQRARIEVEAGNPWNITYAVSKSGATVTVTFALRPGETLMEWANMFDEFGGAGTCPHFGFEADGGIASASWTGNTVSLTLNNPAATWFRLASQVQNVQAMTSSTGDTMSAHRSTLFGSHIWPSRIVPDAILRRPVPGFRGTFSGDTFTPEF